MQDKGKRKEIIEKSKVKGVDLSALEESILFCPLLIQQGKYRM